jgi:SulP family sulfate permease
VAGTSAYASLAAGLIVLTGVLFLCSGLFRLGFITQFLSRPVMDGFVFGLAIFVAVSQLPKLFGLAKGPGDTIRQFAHLVTHLGETSWATFAVGAVALALLFTLDRVRRVPGGLVVLAGAIVVSTVFHLDRHGVAVVGQVPAGLPSLHGLDLGVSDPWVLLPSAAGMMLVIFSEALAHVHAVTAAMLRRSGVTGKPGPVATFPDLDSAVSWARQGARGDVTPAR